jgi:hypothetical protein
VIRTFVVATFGTPTASVIVNPQPMAELTREQARQLVQRARDLQQQSQRIQRELDAVMKQIAGASALPEDREVPAKTKTSK